MLDKPQDRANSRRVAMTDSRPGRPGVALTAIRMYVVRRPARTRGVYVDMLVYVYTLAR